MAIEDEIKQQRFKNAYQKLAINLMFTHSWLMNYTKSIFKKEDITPQQYNILRILRGSMPQPLSTMQIRDRMLDRMSDTSRIVDRLVIKKLVSKKICTEDNRLVDIHITNEGIKLLEKIDGIEDKIALFFDNISPNEAEQMSDMLDKLHSNKT